MIKRNIEEVEKRLPKIIVNLCLKKTNMYRIAK